MIGFGFHKFFVQNEISRVFSLSTYLILLTDHKITKNILKTSKNGRIFYIFGLDYWNWVWFLILDHRKHLDIKYFTKKNVKNLKIVNFSIFSGASVQFPCYSDLGTTCKFITFLGYWMSNKYINLTLPTEQNNSYLLKLL